MKKILLSTLLVFFLLFTGHAGAFKVVPASDLYTLDIDILNSCMVPDRVREIEGGEFKVFEGDPQANRTYGWGEAGPTAGNWIFESFGGNYSVAYDDWDLNHPDDKSMATGRVVTITSDVELPFDVMVFYDVEGKMAFPKGYFFSEEFKETPRPVPGAMLFLGSGLVGVFGLVRRRP